MSCYCRCSDIELVAYAPFGSLGNAVSNNFKSPLKNPIVVKIAKEVHCTPAQVSYLYQLHILLYVQYYISNYIHLKYSKRNKFNVNIK